MAWFYFIQNNSGGSFDHEESQGIGYGLFIEADSADEACVRAESIGLYFDGCDDGVDCDCCGDRWSRPWREKGDCEPTMYGDKYRPINEGEAPELVWGIPLYIHPVDGNFSKAIKVT